MLGFFIGGYYLNSIELNKKRRIFLYYLGCIGAILTIIFQSLVAIKIQYRHSHYYDINSIFVLLQCIAIFVWFKYTEFPAGLNSLSAKLSQYSFGIYLIHPFILEKLKAIFRINTLSFNPIFSVPIIAISVLIISCCISKILNHIPVLKKYIV